MTSSPATGASGIHELKTSILARIHAAREPQPERARVRTVDEALDHRVGRQLVTTADGGTYFRVKDEGHLITATLLARLHKELKERELSLGGLTLNGLRNYIEDRVIMGHVPHMAGG